MISWPLMHLSCRKGAFSVWQKAKGRNAVFLAKLGFEVHAIDFSEVGLTKATSLAAQEGVSITTEVADLGSVVLQPGHWNGIVSIFAHIPAASRRALHAQVVQALASEGLFMLEAYTLRQLKQKASAGRLSTNGIIHVVASFARRTARPRFHARGRNRKRSE